MTISVRERRAGIGLLTALGAERRHVLWLFLAEAMLLAAAMRPVDALRTD